MGNVGIDIIFFKFVFFTFSSEKVLDLCKMGTPPPPVFVKCPRFETV